MRSTAFVLTMLLVVAATAHRAHADGAADGGAAVVVAANVAAADAAATAAAAQPKPPALLAKSAYLVDFASGKVLLERDAQQRLEPASLTKLMTAYVVFRALADGRIALTDEVLVSEKAWRMDGTRMFIEVGSHVRIEDLLRGLLIQSGNDAAVALAEHLGGSVDGFAVLMNEQAAKLGMRDSQFRNPHGLPARGHATTARDLGVLAAALVADFPERYALLKEREFTYNGISQFNRNALLRRDASVDGMKTGHTDAAGYCIVTSADRDGRRLIAVVMGADTANERNDAAQALLDYGFAAFETHRLYKAGDKIVEAVPVRGGYPATAPLAVERDVFVTIPRGGYGGLAASLELGAGLVAPLAPGTRVGDVVVKLAGSPVSQAPVVIVDEVADARLWLQIVQDIGAWFE